MNSPALVPPLPDELRVEYDRGDLRVSCNNTLTYRSRGDEKRGRVETPERAPVVAYRVSPWLLRITLSDMGGRLVGQVRGGLLGGQLRISAGNGQPVGQIRTRWGAFQRDFSVSSTLGVVASVTRAQSRSWSTFFGRRMDFAIRYATLCTPEERWAILFGAYAIGVRASISA